MDDIENDLASGLDGAPFDAGNPDHVARRETIARARQRQADDDLAGLMGEAAGRRFVWSVLTRAGLYRSSLAATPELTAFNEGRRDTGLCLLADLIRVCPAAYARMQREAHDVPHDLPTPTDGETDDRRPD